MFVEGAAEAVKLGAEGVFVEAGAFRELDEFTMGGVAIEEGAQVGELLLPAGRDPFGLERGEGLPDQVKGPLPVEFPIGCEGERQRSPTGGSET